VVIGDLVSDCPWLIDSLRLWLDSDVGLGNIGGYHQAEQSETSPQPCDTVLLYTSTFNLLCQWGREGPQMEGEGAP
jgi:hypothetical protein